MTGVNEIRSTFLNYFKDHGHEIVASGPLVPQNDPTLMFTNAGMVQFKNVFTGVEKRPYNRAVTSQKCVRAGGKHNDLDNVGYTARHHTFFEMLGNFSFGDYFKDVAIELAWNLITKEYGLPRDKLLVTVYGEDDEAFDLWKKIAGLSEDKIIRIYTSDNFWAMGDTGPCGPCSEIFFDHGDHIPGGPPGSADEDGDRFIEIWNLVFMQYEQISIDKRIDLPRPSIDTGMGLERISAVLQGTHDNYETDLMQALIRASVEATSVEATGTNATNHRVIADHLRATSFLIADGVLPSNEGRGYVLRRIMRRAMRYVEMLGVKDPLMWRLVPALIQQMGQAFPELIRAEALITETLKLEEGRFRKTLERGLHILDNETAALGSGDRLSGEVAFKLYDTYGFPLDLTQDALRSRDISVDTDGFNTAMERQRAEARAAWAGSGEAATEEVWFKLRDQFGATEFLGYSKENAEGVVTALVTDGDIVEEASASDNVQIIVNQTPFYGESGGQVGDIGTIRSSNGAVIEISTTQKKLGDVFVHQGQVISGSLKVGDEVELQVDSSARAATRANHSATHLLHEALRRVLGDHVAQKGSLVEPGRLRFDFSQPRPVEGDELARVEEIANSIVTQNNSVVTRLMGVDEAIEQGALALFGEKYGEEVRVVSMGEDRQEDGSTSTYSTELCGGTHVSRTGDIGGLKIISESAVASGVRRIEALSGEGARKHLSEQDARVRAAANLLKTTPANLYERIETLIGDRRAMERELGDARRKLALGQGGSAEGAASAVSDVQGIKVMARALKGVGVKDLRSLVDDAKKQIGSGVVAIVTVTDEGKAGLVVGVTRDLSDRFNAVELVKTGAQVLGGKGGGGRPDMAQAGGPEGAMAEAALEAISKHIGDVAGSPRD
jgi:alanyl-tRNA synthetase